MKKVKKITITIIPVIIAFISLSAPTYALRPQQFGAWIAAALQAINITATATSYAVTDATRDLMDWLAYPEKIIASQFVDVEYTTSLGEIDEYLARSTLKIDKDIVTIDGVEYTDVWLSSDASEKFRVNAFDLENAFDITSQSEGTFASGEGNLGGMPVYRLGNNIVTQKILYRGDAFDSPFAILQFTDPDSQNIRAWYLRNHKLSEQYYRIDYNNDGGGWSWYTANLPVNTNYTVQWSTPAPITATSRWQYTLNRADGTFIDRSSWQNNSNKGFVADPFEFDWVAGTIPANIPMAEDEGLRMRVPTSEIADWYTDNPEMGRNVTINMGDPDLAEKVDDLIDLIIPIIPLIDVDITEAPQPEPEPDPEPVPDPEPYPDPLPDPDISLIDSTLKDIIQALKNIYDSIAIGNTFSEAIKNLNDKINWSLDEIKEKIGDLADRIETGSADFFRDIVDSIWQPFLPILNIFRAGVGIWHHVVDWLQYIHEPFVTFWNFLGSAGYIFVSPIYAYAAAAIVIAIYRRFGR